jgi:hypothetical protein
MRDENRIDSPACASGYRRRAAQVRDPVPQQGIREQTDAVEVDEDRRVPHVLDPAQDRKSASANYPVAQDP